MSVKIQFLKSFILPFYDYCLSLFIYFPKATIQKISNTFYNCIDKLLKIKIEDLKSSEIDSFSEKDNNIDKHQIMNYNNKLKKSCVFLRSSRK